MSLSDLIHPAGTIDRGRYALVGVLLFALKFNLDRLVSKHAFGRPWRLTAYLDVPGLDGITALSGGEAVYGLTLVAVALPFVWIGTVLTLKRLRDAGLPGWLVVLFFAPMVNLVLFAILSVIPSGDTASLQRSERPVVGWLDRAVPRDRLGSAALAVGLTVPAGVLGVLFSTQVLRMFGWGVFVGLPFAQGLVAALLLGYHEERSLGECLAVGLTSVALLGGMLVLVAVEGLICVAMAAPIAMSLATLGSGLGYVIQKRSQGRNPVAAASASLVMLLPVLMVVERLDRQPAPVVSVTTAVDVAAPANEVWSHLVAFTEIAPPTEWLFRTGIAYPIRARIQGTGVGAVRECVFTTGPFLEPITVWNEPHELAFDVASQPDPMQEWTFYRDLRPIHIDGYFRTVRGRFLLEATTEGTRLVGTTWYQNQLWPNRYWSYWSDFILHRIHRRVLEHITRESEDGRKDSPHGSTDN